MLDLPVRPTFLDFHERAFSADDIAFLLTKPSIRGLTFTGCAIGDEEIGALCALPRLERLWLAGSAVTDAVLPAIARVPALNWLVLDNTGITGAGLAALAGHVTLRNLSLRNTRADDACVPYIARIAPLSNVDLAGSAITRDGLLALAAHPAVGLCADDALAPGLAEEFVREQRRLASRTPPGFVAGAGEETAALAALRGFWDGISAWETQLALDKATDPLFTDWRQPVRSAIFAQYCTPRHSTSGQAVASSFGMPPTYARHSVIDVEWLTARKVCVYTTHHAHLQCRFVLMKKGNTWLLDHMQNLFDGWKKGYL
ncbi:NTF2 fold immunity protein [Massilia rubra]|nr:NTF2 fold immunity protein [Massilia rubra]